MDGLEGEQIDKVYTKGNTCYAVTLDSNCYCWGDLRYGMSLS